MRKEDCIVFDVAIAGGGPAGIAAALAAARGVAPREVAPVAIRAELAKN